MRRQSKYKHRITALMLEQVRAQQYLLELAAKLLEKVRPFSEVMAEIYAKTRAERGQA
jgi:hypothetical protein